MKQKIKVGVIGAGAVGQMHIEHWLQVPGCEIVALADLRSELLSLVTEKFKIPFSYSNHTELLKNPDIEAVVVVTRRDNNAAVVYDCLKAGKHVFSEKPMAKTFEQSRKLVETAQSTGLTYAVGYQRRHDAGTQIAKKAYDDLIATQKLGKILSVRSWNFTGQDRITDGGTVMTAEERPTSLQWSPVPEWLAPELHPTYDRFVNVCCHDINMLRYFFNDNPSIISADLDYEKGWNVTSEFDDIEVTFEGGLNELRDWSDRGQWDEGLEIVFEKGSLQIKFSPPLIHHLSNRVELISGDSKQVLSSGDHQEPAFKLQAANFIDSILYNKDLIASGSDSMKDLEFIDSLWKDYAANKNPAQQDN